MAQVPPGGWDFRFADPEDDFGGMQQKRSFRPIDQEPRPAVVRIAGNGALEAERRMGGMEPEADACGL